jgi:ribosome biogenesis GTPase
VQEASLPGLVIQAQSGFFKVETEFGTFTCRLRGRLKRGKANSDLVAIGDQVRVRAITEGTGVIESVEPRSGAYRQVLLANADQAVFVFACARPDPHLRMLDRFLVIAEKQEIPSLIVANKIDLVTEHVAEELFAPYKPAGYDVLYTSVKTCDGVLELGKRLAHKISVLAGPSGAGKSSLLNAICPGLDLRVQDVGAVNKGQHTTVVRRLHRLDAASYVADTPGWKSLALWDTEPEEIDGYFPEIRPLVRECKFSDCRHLSEPGCAVRDAVDSGSVHPARYESYVRLRAGES